MSRRDEVDVLIGEYDWNMMWKEEAMATRDLARTLADEVDAKDEIITKLLVAIKPTEEDDRLREFSNAACDRYGIKQGIYNRALEIAGRKE